MLDAGVAIGLRDGDEAMLSLVAELDGPFALSIINWVELEGGVYRIGGGDIATRRARLDYLLESLAVFPFDDAAAAAYRQIVAHAGYTRRKILDRVIAATALVRGATLVTTNPQDFSDIPGLECVGS